MLFAWAVVGRNVGGGERRRREGRRLGGLSFAWVVVNSGVGGAESKRGLWAEKVLLYVVVEEVCMQAREVGL